ncbi:hypothetical protein BH09PAT2_BH09PAT2_03260 [soil metagenome]
MGLIVSLLVNALAVAFAAYLLTPHVKLDGFMTAVIVSIVLALMNTFVKPIISLLTLPINLLTLGLFSFIINGILILFISGIIDGFQVENFGWAIVFSIVLSIISSILGIVIK